MNEIIECDRNIWFTSDLHFMHKNIVKYCNRPVLIENHTEWLIDKLNSVIGKNDEVYHLGDFSFGSYEDTLAIMKRLNGKWYYLKGNHDNHERMINLCKESNSTYLGSSLKNIRIQYHSQKKSKFFVLCHFPIVSWENRGHGSIHCHGHVHNSVVEAPKVKNRFNVCFDLDFRPFHISEILNDNMGEFKNASTKIGHQGH